jgi:nitroreductase
MEVLEAIKKRRSIRKFKEDYIADKLIDEIIDAGRLAPSGSNRQPLQVVILTSEDIRKRLQENGAFGQEFVHKSPAILVIHGDPEIYEKGAGPGLKGKGKERCLRDLSIASGFMALRAADLGLASIWIGLMDREVLKKELKIPDKNILPFILCLGYPDEEPAPLSRKPLAEVISSRS